MSRPSRWMLPAPSVSRPAIRRSSVDLPQPDGPTNTVNWPRAIDRSMPLIVFTSPNCFSTPLSWRNVIFLLLVAYLTAPNVRPCTSCFWLNQPNTTMGAMASPEAADNLDQNRPSGLEYD